MEKQEQQAYEYWKEYPERDPQAVVWYPCHYYKINPVDVWQNSREEKKEIGFYIHIPFCKGVCQYCPFNKYNWSKDKAEQYVATVKKEIEMVTKNAYFDNKTIVAGYLGGGTPTSLSTEQLKDIILTYKKCFRISENAEMTVEATPDTIDEEKLMMLKEMGYNRISFGVQSFNKRILKIMGRAHSGQRSIEAIQLAKKVGFDVISIDLLYKVPGQSMSEWEADLKTAISLDIDHITTFSLFLDPGTKLYDDTINGKALTQPDEAMELDMFHSAVDLLKKEGYYLYSLYDFAKPGKECLHHAINWQSPQGDYVSFGPGAFSFINNGNQSHIYCNINSLTEYFETVNEGKQPIEFGKVLTEQEEMSRYMVLGINFLKVLKEPFYKLFGMKIEDVYSSQLLQLNEWELINEDDTAITLTEKGKLYLANVSKMFFTDENRYMPHIIGVELQSGEGLSLGGLDFVKTDDSGKYKLG